MDRLTEDSIQRHLDTFGREMQELQKEQREEKELGKERIIKKKLIQVNRIYDSLIQLRTAIRTEKEKQDI